MSVYRGYSAGQQRGHPVEMRGFEVQLGTPGHDGRFGQLVIGQIADRRLRGWHPRRAKAHFIR